MLLLTIECKSLGCHESSNSIDSLLKSARKFKLVQWFFRKIVKRKLLALAPLFSSVLGADKISSGHESNYEDFGFFQLGFEFTLEIDKTCHVETIRTGLTYLHTILSVQKQDWKLHSDNLVMLNLSKRCKKNFDWHLSR